jgi:Tfp pilus assembly protein PilO
MSFLDQLNLRPQEKRLVVGALAVVVLVLSVFFIWPKTGEWRKAQDALEKSRKTLKTQQTEIARIPEFETRLTELEGQGSAVLQEEQALQLMRSVQEKAQEHQVTITSTRSGIAGGTTSTNAFFDEQTVIVGVSTGERELVNFLHALGTGTSMIRVRDMDLRPDVPRYRLNGSITLVASYQKKPKVAPKPAPKPTVSPAPASPATSVTNVPARTP